MREILFRAKRPNGEWREGSLLFYPDVNRAFISSGEYKSIGGTVEVDKRTIGQYIGLTDKNGKKIFEGDIVLCKVIGIREEKIHKGFVEYTEDSFGVNIKGIVPTQKCLAFSMHNGDVEIIGNIHDNPELLKEGVYNA